MVKKSQNLVNVVCEQPLTRGKPSIIATQGGLHKELAGGLKKPRTRPPFSYEYTLLHKVTLAISFEFINVRNHDRLLKTRPLWHYRLWSFQGRGTKLERFLHNNQHAQRKLLNFENWTNGEPQ